MFQPGETLFNKYRIERLLGQGAAGQVYLATHLKLNVPRAIKVLRKGVEGVGSSDFADFEKRFKLEAQLGARLKYPNLVPVYDFEAVEDTLALVMEYCPGGSLQERIDAVREGGKPIPVAEVVRIGAQVAEGLAGLHKKQIVHRDLKPNNVLFDEQGAARVADLGLAQVPGGPSLRGLKSDAQPHPGTPGYMSPEQEHGRGMLTRSSDVYALGLVLFELLTSELYCMAKPGTRARELRADVPEWLEELLVRLLQVEPQARPWDGTEAGELLRMGEAVTQKETAERVDREREQQREDQTRKEAQQKAKQLAEEQARQDAEGKSHLELETKIRQEKEEEARLAAERAVKNHQEIARRDAILRVAVTARLAAQKRARQQKAADEDATRQAAQEKERRETPGTVQRKGDRLSVLLAPGVEMEFVRVPAGEFLMGSKEGEPDAYDVEKPQHKVYLDEYWMGKAPVTVAQFEAFVKASGRRTTAVLKKAAHPVTLVSWENAEAFVQWLDGLIQAHRKGYPDTKDGLPSGLALQLPTEAEWEKAARGTDARVYPWGNEIPDRSRCNYGIYIKDTTPVGQYSPKGDSPYGCVDMAGNVWEWVADWYGKDYYRNSPSSNPPGPTRGTNRVVRGGSWNDSVLSVSSAFRDRRNPGGSYNYLGFRCALS